MQIHTEVTEANEAECQVYVIHRNSELPAEAKQDDFKNDRAVFAIGFDPVLDGRCHEQRDQNYNFNCAHSWYLIKDHVDFFVPSLYVSVYRSTLFLKHAVDEESLVVVDDVFLHQIIELRHSDDIIRVYSHAPSFSGCVKNLVCFFSQVLQLLSFFDVAG